MLRSKYSSPLDNFVCHGTKDVGGYTYVLLIDLVGLTTDEADRGELSHVHSHGVTQQLRLVEPEFRGAEHVPAEQCKLAFGLDSSKPTRGELLDAPVAHGV